MNLSCGYDNFESTRVPLAEIIVTENATGISSTLELPENTGTISSILDSVQHENMVYFLAHYLPGSNTLQLPLALWSLDLSTGALKIHRDEIIDKPFSSTKLRIISEKVFLHGYNHNNHFLYSFNPENNTWQGIDLGGAASFEIGTHPHEIIYHNDKFYSVGVSPDSYPAVLRLLVFDPATALTKDLTPMSAKTSVSGPAQLILSSSSSIVWFDSAGTMYQYNTDFEKPRAFKFEAFEKLAPLPFASTDNYLVFNPSRTAVETRAGNHNNFYILDLNRHQIQALKHSDAFVKERGPSGRISPIFETDDRVLLTTNSLAENSALWIMDFGCNDQ